MLINLKGNNLDVKLQKERFQGSFAQSVKSLRESVPLKYNKKANILRYELEGLTSLAKYFTENTFYSHEFFAVMYHLYKSLLHVMDSEVPANMVELSPNLVFIDTRESSIVIKFIIYPLDARMHTYDLIQLTEDLVLNVKPTARSDEEAIYKVRSFIERQDVSYIEKIDFCGKEFKLLYEASQEQGIEVSVKSKSSSVDSSLDSDNGFDIEEAKHTGGLDLHEETLLGSDVYETTSFSVEDMGALEQVYPVAELIGFDGVSYVFDSSTGKEEWRLGKNPTPVNLPFVEIIAITSSKYLSRNHLTISCNQGDFYVTDVGSTNGTKVNDSKITPNMPQLLNNGDRLEFGRLKFNFVKRS